MSPLLIFIDKMKSGRHGHQYNNTIPKFKIDISKETIYNTINAPDRVNFIDSLRFIMCIGIAIYHFIPYFYSNINWEYNISLFLSYFTDMFFFLSGFFAAKSSLERFEQSGLHSLSALRSWFARVYPLHVITFSFYLSILLLNQFWPHGLISPGRYDTQNILPNILLLHGVGIGNGLSFNYPSWAISAIFWSYCLFLVAAPLHRFDTMRLSCLLLVSVAFALALQHFEVESISKMQENNLGFFRALPSFLLGAVLYRCPKPRVPDGVSLVLFAAAIALLFAHPAPLVGMTRILAIGLVFYVLLIAHQSGSRLLRLLRPLERWGKISFGVYLWHGVVATILLRILFEGVFGDLHQFAAHHPIAADLEILIALGASIGLAFFSRATLEKAAGALVSRLAAHSMGSLRSVHRYFQF